MSNKDKSVETKEPAKKVEKPKVRMLSISSLKHRDFIINYAGEDIVLKGLTTIELPYDAKGYKVLKQYENLKFITLR